MKREFLKDLGLADEVIEKIMAENGKDIEAAKGVLAQKEAELSTAKQTISNLQNTVKQFDGVDVQKLKDDVSAWEKKYNEDLGKLKLENALELALRDAKAKNTTAVKALLTLEEIKLDGDKLLGLDSQLEKVKADNSYLFDDVEAKEEGSQGTSVSTGGAHGTDLSGNIDKFLAGAMAGAGVTLDTNTK